MVAVATAALMYLTIAQDADGFVHQHTKIRYACRASKREPVRHAPRVMLGYSTPTPSPSRPVPSTQWLNFTIQLDFAEQGVATMQTNRKEKQENNKGGKCKRGGWQSTLKIHS